jgi:hypothetical protein
MKKLALWLLSAVLCAGSALAAPRTEKWTPKQASAWQAQQPWYVGCNFIPSTAVNQLEMWQADTFDPKTIDRELKLAEGAGMNSVRVFLHDLAYDQDPEGFLKRVDQYLKIADKHKIKTLFVFFDDCWLPEPRIGKQPAPVPSVHNSGWLKSPGVKGVTAVAAGDAAIRTRLEKYVKAVLTRFAQDKRILGWDLYNEPGNGLSAANSNALLKLAFQWAWEINPSQPLTSGVFSGDPIKATQLANSDIITFHVYSSPEETTGFMENLAKQSDRPPFLCTEFMARPSGSTFAGCLPVFKQRNVGAMCWGLVRGKTNTIWGWGTKEGAPEPKLWFHDVFLPNGTPYKADELAAIRNIQKIPARHFAWTLKKKVPMLLATADAEPALWKWTTQTPPANWETPGFNDQAWQTGKSGFGVAGTPNAIVGTAWETADIWLRREFELPEGKLEAPGLRMHHDEDAEVYLNGKLAAKLAGFTRDYEVVAIQAEALATLKPGKNTIAVHCHQTTGGQYIDVGLVSSATGPTTVTVSSTVAVPQPVSPQLISGFLELAFGRSDLISAELLLDRGFEMADTDTLNSGGGWCVRIKPKLELEDWWHSGYEEHRWRLVKAADDKTSTFKRLGGTWPSAPNGKLYGCLENRSKTEPVALAQDGVWVNAGVNYEFSGLLCDGTMFSNVPVSAKPVPVQVSLYPENQLDGQPLSTVTITIDAPTCRKFTATLPAPATSGRTTFVVKIPAGRKLVCDMLSLLPATHVGTIRKEVIDGMKQVPAAVIRFPGGCFASTYRWRDGIGDRDCRPVDTAHWWNFPMLNDIGTVEFLTLCKAIGSEPMMCVPVMFDDAYSAADWVAFCNTDKHPLLAKAGLKRAPMKVTYWELDNETYRRMDAITYAHRCVEFSRAMKQVDPSIKTIMDCYWIYHGKLKEMLEIAGADIDIVNNRGGNIAELRGDIATLAEYNAAHNRSITLCHSEYRANSYDLPTEPQAADATQAGLNIPKQKDEKDSATAKASRWSYGLSVLCDFLEYQNFGGGFQFANFTGYNDGWGESMINCAKSKVYPSPTGQAFNFLRRQQMAWPLACEIDNDSPLLRTQVAWDLKKQTLILFALNLSSQPRTITFDLSEVNGKFSKTAQVESLSAPVANAVVKEDAPSPIVNETTELKHDGKKVTVTLKPYSATAVRLK